MMIGIAAMAILIANMGLFGLVSLYISKRMKEFSIRKVMGASMKELSYQVARGFLWVILIASVLGAPLAFLMSNSLITQMYSYHFQDNAIPLLFTALILFLAVLITVSSQAFKAITVNPAKQLRDE
jgi:ABC-type antimicrobial peptide transport system permease subunit